MTDIDPYRARAAERLREWVEGVEPRLPSSEAHRTYERANLAARAQIEQWDALRAAIREALDVDLQDGEATAELRRLAGQPSAQRSIDEILEARAQARAEALRQAASPLTRPRGDGTKPAPPPDPDYQDLARADFLSGHPFAQVAHHQQLAASGRAGDGGAGTFAAEIAERERQMKEAGR